MLFIFYLITFILSMICSAIYVFMWHKHFDINFTMIFTLIPIACLGYVLFGLTGNLGEAILANKIIYIGGSFLQLFILFSIFNLCKIELKGWVRLVLFLISAALFASVLTMGFSDIFYKNVSFEIIDGNPVLNREYGFMHTAFYVVLFGYFLAGIIVIIYSWFRKKQVPRTIIAMLVIPDLLCILSYVFAKKVIIHGDILPLGYVLAEVVYLLIAHRVTLYDVGETVVDSMVREREIGFISFDSRYRYLGSNEKARELMPGLEDVAVDAVMDKSSPYASKLLHYMDSFVSDENRNQFVYTVHDPDGNEENDRIYNVNVNYLYAGSRRKGYIITFTDDTQNRKYIRLLDNYNEQLRDEVEEKTRHIVVMHDNLIMSLATMVESRDNSTGGHIRRTSEGVRILIDEIMKEGELSLSPEFCRAVIKAAPMHDLGKIAVDDAVLRKPGRFTDEEYEKMKQHAAEGARVIHEILLNTDDELFKQVAENVAHYHHERWDGSGYPERLSGEEIPLEARIMAIADVYDALVSKRVYKEAFDFEKANAIITEGMGTQFDPGLKSIYEKARPSLEAYYSSSQETL